MNASTVFAWTNPSVSPAAGGGMYVAEQNSPANTVYIKSNGNVGVGMTNPTAKMNIGLDTSFTSGTASMINWTAATTGASSNTIGLNIDFNNFTPNATSSNTYGVFLDDPVNANGSVYGLYVSGSNWDYGIYSADNVYFTTTSYMGDTSTYFDTSGRLFLPASDYIQFDTAATQIYASADAIENLTVTAAGHIILNPVSNVGIGNISPTAYLNIKAGTAAAGTAPLKFTTGVNLTAPEAGAVEWDGTNLFITQDTGPTRKTIAYTDSASTGTITAANVSSGAFGANTGGGNYSFPANVAIGTSGTPAAALDVRGLMVGGFGAQTTAGTLDWNDVSNSRSGSGYSLLLGSATNGPGSGNYFHPFSFEYSNKDGTGNVTQFAIPYGNSSSINTGMFMRGRYGGAWTSWVKVITSDTSGNVTFTGNTNLCHLVSYSGGTTSCPAGYYTWTGTALASGTMLCCKVDNPL